MSAVEFWPAQQGGSVEIVCSADNDPRSPFQVKEVTVDAISLITKTNRRLGWNARWRGPAPESNAAKGGSFGTSLRAARSRRYTTMRSRPRSATRAKLSVGSRLIE